MTAWKHTLRLTDVFHNEELSLRQKTKSIVARIKMAAWFEEANYNGDLASVLEELTDAAEEDDASWWDSAWAAFYDIADAERVWVKINN